MNYEPPQRGFRTFLLLTGLGVFTFFTVRLGQVAIRSYTQANVTEEPQNVKITNLGPTKVTLSWQTKTPTAGYLRVSDTTNNFEEVSANIQSNHHLTIEDLQSNTTYQYQIGVGSKLYSGTNPPYEFKTSFQYKPQSAQRAFGQVIEMDGSPAKRALVYINIKDNDSQDSLGISTTLSGLTNASGIFSIDLEEAKSRDLTAPFYFSSKGGDLVEISAVGERGEEATLILTLNQTQPTPQIQLGADSRILDLTNQPKVKSSHIILSAPESTHTNKQDRLRTYLIKLLIH